MSSPNVMRTVLVIASLLALVVLSLSGCSVQPPYQPPVVNTPPQWSKQALLPATDPVWPVTDWWMSFQDPGLDALTRRVLAQNHDLRAAAARIEQARSVVKVVDANRSPAFGGGVGVERSRALTSGARTDRNYTLDLGVSYEVDLWKRFDALTRNALAQADAAAETERVTRLTLAAETAQNYFALAALDDRIALVRQTIATADRVDRIIEERYRAGAVSGLDRAQSRTNLVNIRASLPPLEIARTEAQNALAVLSARVPGSLEVVPPAVMKIVLPSRLPTGVPSEILRRRPDIRLVEANLLAAHADIGVARANLYPSLQLTADTGFASPDLTKLVRGSSGVLTLAANLLTPIFQGERLRALVDRSEYRYQELIENYHQTVHEALREVENVLVALERLAEQEAVQKDAIAAAQDAFDIARVRYESGLTDAINLLTAQNTLLAVQTTALQIRAARIGGHVALFKGLGGGL